MMYIEDCCEILDSMRIPITAENRKEGEYPYYGANGIQGYVDDYIFDGEFVLLAEDGGNFGSKEKPIAYRISGKCWVNNHAHVLKPKAGLDVDYLCYSLMFYKVDGMVNGATRQKLTQAAMRKMQIPSRSIEEQEYIVDELNRISKMREQRKLELKLLDDLIKARFVEMFGDVKHEEKYKGIPLRELCLTMSGGTPSTKNTEYYEGNIPWITTVSLGPNHIDGSTAKGYITQDAIKNSATKLIPAGNILFGTRVGVGKSSINDVDICTNQDIIAIIGIDENKFNRVFIKHVLDNYQPYYDNLKKGATILGITSDDLKDTLIPDAPIDVQTEFVAFVEQVDKSKVAIQKSLDETQLLFDSLMQKYFG